MDSTASKVGGFAVVAMGAVGVFALVMVGGMLWSAFVLLKLWDWFILPAFGLAVPSYPLAIGLALFVHFLWGKTTLYKNHEMDTPASLMAMTLGPAFALLFGWITTLFL